MNKVFHFSETSLMSGAKRHLRWFVIIIIITFTNVAFQWNKQRTINILSHMIFSYFSSFLYINYSHKYMFIDDVADEVLSTSPRDRCSRTRRHHRRRCPPRRRPRPAPHPHPSTQHTHHTPTGKN